MAAKTKARGGKGKTVKDFQNGHAKDDHKVEIDGDGANEVFEPSGETLDELLAKIATNDDEVEAIQERIRQRNEPDRKKIAEKRKEVTEAKTQLVKDGYPTLELNVLIRQFRLRREADKAPKELDAAQLKRHKELEAAWKDFAGTPLGAHAERAPAHADS